ncbi:hypothetical protein [Polyangium aurulentum]|uniref:hypothetical protein n=1 Tax=Polyangium aurulentum TaxID=2567896 RepID=UPI0010AE4635|nr:hypothetical protein [Polyangium aurulentum]UQA62521.1 hypothetical protein E8A73_019535 [Polyangium aurulentum]
MDRLLVEATWMRECSEYMDDVRTWLGLEGAVFLAWKDVARAARGRVPPRHGHFAGEPGVEDARNAVLALRLFQTLPRRPDAVVLARDSDGRPEERRKGLEQARQDALWPFAVVLGVAHHNREAWVLAGFEPGGEEADGLEEERKALGFYPNREPNRLDAQDENALRSAKRVLAKLTGGRQDREERCWTETSLETLKARGAEAGLGRFIDEVLTRLVPAMNGRRTDP